MVRCSVIGCKSDSGTKMPDLSFHSFPEDDYLRRYWVVATGRTDWTPKPSSKICSIHFEKKMLIKKKKLTLLLPNAVPILIKVTSGPSPVLQKCQVKVTLCPDFNPVITQIKSEADPIKQQEDPQSDDTLSLAEDTDQLSDADQPSDADQLSEDMVQLSNAQVPLSNAPDPLSDVKVEELEVEVDELEVTGPEEVKGPVEVTTPAELTRAVEVPLPLHLKQELFRAGNDCFNLIRIQASQINKLTIRCGKHRQKMRSYVQLVRRRDKKISELRTEVEALRSIIGERDWEASSIGGKKVDAPRIQIQSSNTAIVKKKPNRKILVVKSDYNRPKSLVSAQTTSDIQNSSVSVKRTLIMQENSSVGIPDTSDVLQKSSVGVKSTLDFRKKSPVAIQGTSSKPNTSLVGLQSISNINIQLSSDTVKRTSAAIQQKSSSGIPSTSNALQKSPAGCQRTLGLGIRQKSSAGVIHISDIPHDPSIAVQPISDILQASGRLQRMSDIRQNALVIQIDGMHDTVLQPKLVRLDDNSMETG